MITITYQIPKYFFLFSLLSLDCFLWLQFPLVYRLYVHHSYLFNTVS